MLRRLLILGAIVVATATVLVSTTLHAQNPEWMLFTPDNWGGMENDAVGNLAVDPQGHIWVARFEPASFVGRGVAEFDGQTWRAYDKSNSGLPGDMAFPLGFDLQGNAWFGTASFWDEGTRSGGGLAKFDGTTWTVYTVQNSGLPSNNIRSGTIDRDGRIWLGTTAGVVRFDGEVWTLFTKEQLGLPSNICSAIAQGPRGDIWAGSYADAGGVAKFDGQTWSAYTPDDSEIPATAILRVVFDSKGDPWFGSWGTLIGFDGNSWTVYDGDPLLGTWGLAVDAQGTIWAGGGAVMAWFHTVQGITTFDGQTWNTYTRDNSGLPSRKVFALAPDRHGNMWMGTELGLVVYRQGGVILPGTVTAVEEDPNAAVPSALSLHQNYPNPFNPITTITYDLPEAADVTLTIHSATGQHVATLVSSHQPAGYYHIVWDGGSLADGVYFCRLLSGERMETKRMVLMK